MLSTFKNATPEALAAVAEEKRVRSTNEVFLFFTNGSQFDFLIMQRVAALGVYILAADPASVTTDDVRALAPTGIILSGGPASVHSEPPPFDSRIFDLGIPVLGICLGFQMWAKHVGATVESGRRQYSVHELNLYGEGALSPLFTNVPIKSKVLQSHGDEVTDKDGLLTVYGTSDGVIAAASYGHLYGVQFHPECTDTVYGTTLFSNFVFAVCNAKDRYPAEDAARKLIEQLVIVRKRGVRVLLLLSGGSDSSVLAFLFKEAGFDRSNLRAVYIKGMDRRDDEDYVRKCFGNQSWIKVTVVNAKLEFLAALKGKVHAKDKRGDGFKPVYNSIGGREAEVWSESGAYEVLVAQGTLYTDLVESGLGLETGARRATIKSHHNTKNEFRSPRTGELFGELTPLDSCVKDSAREIGRIIGVPQELLVRHPFPGPGKSLRVDGEVTEEKLAIEDEVDAIWIEELRTEGLYEKYWQAGANVLDTVHTTSEGDDSGSGYIIMLWAVHSVNGFTATHCEPSWEFLDRVQQRIMNEVKGVGAVVYRISNKPKTTIEQG